MFANNDYHGFLGNKNVMLTYNVKLKKSVLTTL